MVWLSNRHCYYSNTFHVLWNYYQSGLQNNSFSSMSQKEHSKLTMVIKMLTKRMTITSVMIMVEMVMRRNKRMVVVVMEKGDQLLCGI